MKKIPCPLCRTSPNKKVAFIGNRIFPINISLCSNCGFVFQNPRFSEVELDEYYLKDYDKFHRPKPNSRISENVDKTLSITYNRILPFIKERSNPRNILEVGAGNGEIISYLAEKIHFENIYAFEPSERCQESLKQKNIVVLGRSTNNFTENVYNNIDLIIMRHVLEHIYDPVEELKKITQLLNKDGLFYIAVPNLLGFNNILNSLSFPHISYFNKFTLEKTANLVGLKVIELLESGDELYGVFQKTNEDEFFRDELNSSDNVAQTITYVSKNIKKSNYLFKTLKRKLTYFIPDSILKNFLLKKNKSK